MKRVTEFLSPSFFCRAVVFSITTDTVKALSIITAGWHLGKMYCDIIFWRCKHAL